jgi:hypothetical protein
VVLVEGGLEDLAGVDAQPGEEFGVRAGDASRGLLEAGAVGVVADGRQDLSDGGFDPAQVHRVFDGAAVDAAVDESGGQVVEFSHRTSLRVPPDTPSVLRHQAALPQVRKTGLPTR